MSTMMQARQMDAESERVAAAEAAADRTATQPTQAESILGPNGLPTNDGWRRIGELFRVQMPTKAFNGRGGKSFSYITARQVAERLDKVVRPGNWATEVRVVRSEHPVAVLVGVGVFGVWKWDAGYSNNPEADSESDRSFENEPLKAAVSDGFKRAAVQWGIGRWLYGDT